MRIFCHNEYITMEHNDISWIRPLGGFATAETSLVPSSDRLDIELKVDGETYSGTTEATLELLGRPRISLSCIFGDMDEQTMESIQTASSTEKEKMEFRIDGCDNSQLSFGEFYSEICDGRLHLALRLENISANFYMKKDALIFRAVFHLFNFMEIKDETDADSIKRLDLVCEKWHITLVSLPETRSIIHGLRTKGGYRLTHMGGIERKDGSDFTAEELEEILKDLRYILSFAKGGWSIPICPVGYDKEDVVVWRGWSAPLEAWSGPFRWLDAADKEQLPMFYRRFMQKTRKRDCWRLILLRVIDWYLNANNSSYLSKEGGIILAQVALESLANKCLTIEELKTIKKSADRMTKLFDKLNIPTEITIATEKLYNYRPKFDSAPDALAKVRNSLVHHTWEDKRDFSDLHDEAWKLGLWYLELSILSICGYRGRYKNRLTQETENVPWLEDPIK